MVSANRISLNAYSGIRLLLQSCRSAGRLVKPLKALARHALMAALILPTFGLCARAAPLGESPVPPSESAPPAGGTRDPAGCQTVRFSDVGWTDVTATTALVTQLLRSIGYSPTVTVLSVPVTFASVQNKDIDVCLVNWMPAQGADRGHYVEDGSVVGIGANLTG